MRQRWCSLIMFTMRTKHPHRIRLQIQIQTQTHRPLREEVQEGEAVPPIPEVDATSRLMGDRELQSVLPRRRFLWLRFRASQIL